MTSHIKNRKAKMRARGQTGCRLESLRLRGNGIGDTGVAEICRAFLGRGEHQALRFLHLERNGITDNGASALATALKQDRTLTALHMFGNSVGKSGAMSLLAAMRTNAGVDFTFTGRLEYVCNVCSISPCLLILTRRYVVLDQL